MCISVAESRHSVHRIVVVIVGKSYLYSCSIRCFIGLPEKVCLFLSVCIAPYLALCHSRIKQMLIVRIFLRVPVKFIHHSIKEYIVFTARKELAPWYCNIVLRWRILYINNTIISLIECTVVNPDSVTRTVDCHIIPIVSVIITACLLIPLPEFIELDISYDNIAWVLHCNVGMLYWRTVWWEDCHIGKAVKHQYRNTCLNKRRVRERLSRVCLYNLAIAAKIVNLIAAKIYILRYLNHGLCTRCFNSRQCIQKLLRSWSLVVFTALRL